MPETSDTKREHFACEARCDTRRDVERLAPKVLDELFAYAADRHMQLIEEQLQPLPGVESHGYPRGVRLIRAWVPEAVTDDGRTTPEYWSLRADGLFRRLTP